MARTLTHIENQPGNDTKALLKELYPHTGRALILGITGSPGSGKSTLVDRLAHHYLTAGKRVGIVAVDPTSPFTGGAILGDRIRMQKRATEPGIFIRSMATRGKMGGLSAAVNDALIILDAAGYDILMVETVGVGQDEVDIVKTAQVTAVVLVPGMGDDIQAIKAGIMEIGDIFVINKADRDGVLRTRRELEALLSISRRSDGWDPEIVETIATEGESIDELAEAVDRYVEFLKQPEHSQARRRPLFRERLQDLLRSRLEQWALDQIPEDELDSMAEALMDRSTDPYTLLDQIFARLGLEGREDG